jgi:hypothetical protein
VKKRKRPFITSAIYLHISSKFSLQRVVSISNLAIYDIKCCVDGSRADRVHPFVSRDVLEGTSEKTKIVWPKNEQPKMPTIRQDINSSLLMAVSSPKARDSASNVWEIL